jgi:hypothetical protein
MQYEARRTMTEKISHMPDHEQLTVITVGVRDQAAIHWIREKKEFLYQNAMYDVVKVKTSNNQVSYYCINDTQEKQIINNFEKTAGKRMNTSKSRLLSKLIIHSLYFDQATAFCFLNIPHDVLFTGLVFPCTSTYKEILTPPPERPFIS